MIPYLHNYLKDSFVKDNCELAALFISCLAVYSYHKYSSLEKLIINILIANLLAYLFTAAFVSTETVTVVHIYILSTSSMPAIKYTLSNFQYEDLLLYL